MSCNDESESSDQKVDSTTLSENISKDLEVDEENDPAIAGIKKDSIPQVQAIQMIKNFQGNSYKLQMARLDSRKLRQLTRGSDSVRLWMAVTPANAITMILQQKISGGSRHFVYYDLSEISKSATTAGNVLCPEPPNCDVYVEQ